MYRPIGKFENVMTPDILYEDNHLVIVNKPNGILTHGDPTGDPSMETMVQAYLKEKYNKPGNVYGKSVHRLDRPVSGALMIARTSKAHERMAKQFRDRQVFKTYWALTTRKPSPEEGKIVQYLQKDRKRNVVLWSDDPVEGYVEAITEYHVLGEVEPFYLVALHPLTGRSHQLRVAMRAKRCPIAGDVKYNGTRIGNPRAILLHSREIRFTHPVRKEELVITAPLPDLEQWRLFEAMV